MNRAITLQTPYGPLHAQFERPDEARGLVLLARARHTPADPIIASHLVACGYAIFSVELVSSREIHFVDATQNVPRLAQRLIDFLDQIRHDSDMQDLPLAVFSSGDTTPAAIRAAAQRDIQIKAVACHGGIVDRAGLQALKLLVAPMLMLLDTDDELAQASFNRAKGYLGCTHELHLLEPGEDPVIRVAGWLTMNLPG